MYTMVTVRCGHCANLLSVNMAEKEPLGFEEGLSNTNVNNNSSSKDCGGSTSGSSSSSKYSSSGSSSNNSGKQQQVVKRQRVPSAYNRFIKEEIQRIKASNPEISHREAFSTAAKNWAHFPHIHFGLKLEGNKNKHAKLGDHHHHHHFHHHQNQQAYGGSSANDDNIINDHNIGTLVLNHHKKTPNNNSSNDNGFYHELNGSL
ncbi:unnamed protein product [Linum tenue]|uniref:Uncharacterized protein n=1 Tax=Linum tenue TaxID=586396 RepID=A0AAV0QBG8_9ROSI|nr:unnamed protein product [Linum tenue]